MIPVNDLSRGPTIEETEAMARVAKSGWYLHGPETELFEHSFASYVGVEHAVGVASGTDALTLALAALGIGRGKRVGTVANAGGYSSVACRQVGADPVFIDVDRETACMSPDSLGQHVDDLDVLIVTHTYGRMADMDRLLPLADAANIPVIEDCAHAPGARSASGAVGSFGELAAFSFYPTKNLAAMGDAGMVVGKDPQTMARVRKLALYGWESRFIVGSDGGFNSRMDELQAAVLNVRLPRLEVENKTRRKIASMYAEALTRSNGSQRLLFVDSPLHVAHLAVVECDRREGLAAHLEGSGVETAVHYPVPDYRQPAWDVGHRGLPATDHLCERVLTLPCFPTMTDAEIACVVAAVESFTG